MHRVALVLVFGIVLLGHAHRATAGTLSRARGESRESKSDKKKEKKSDSKPKTESKPSGGTLSSVRTQVRVASSASGGGHKNNHHKKHSHKRRGGGHHHHSHSSVVFAPVVYDPYPVGPTYVERHVYLPAEPAVVTETVPAPPAYEPTLATPDEYTSPATSFAGMFPAYPYSDGTSGCLAMTDACDAKPWSGRLEFDTQSDFDGLSRHGIGFFIEGSAGLGLDFDWGSYSESLPGGGHDELHLGEMNVMYRISETPYSLWRAGIGLNWLGDRYDTDYGVNFSLKADFMPCDPLVFSGEVDLGTIGDAEMLHGAATMGVMLNRCEIFGGYDYRRIGDVELKGPTLGIRVWF